MGIKRVWIDPGCISCNLSEDTCPEVFEVKEEGATVKEGADLVLHEAKIREAAEGCPVEVIKFEQD